jgi:hypothetical protein
MGRDIWADMTHVARSVHAGWIFYAYLNEIMYVSFSVSLPRTLNRKEQDQEGATRVW